MTTIEAAIERFLGEMQPLENKSAHTVRTYKTGMGHFQRYLTTLGKPPNLTPTSEILPDMVSDFAGWLQVHNPVGHPTLMNYLTSCNQFLVWLTYTKLCKFDMTDWTILQERLRRMRKAREEDRLPHVPNEVDVQLVRATASLPSPSPAPSEKEETRLQLIALRNDAIVEALRSTGCRVSEVAAMNRTDLDTGCKSALVRGKGKKKRFVYFDDAARNSLQAYWSARDAAQIARNGAEPAFARHDKRASGQPMMHMSTNAFREVLDLLCKRAGVAHEHPHQYRHRMATRALRETNNLAIVQELLGHSSPNTTKIYARLTDEQLRSAHESINLE